MVLTAIIGSVVLLFVVFFVVVIVLGAAATLAFRVLTRLGLEL